jgi:hypothetical protein
MTPEERAAALVRVICTEEHMGRLVALRIDPVAWIAEAISDAVEEEREACAIEAEREAMHDGPCGIHCEGTQCEAEREAAERIRARRTK